ncbi:MAG: HEAT repeat domain-containing protein [Verrucomicrobiaceae bacterium]|nr:HEAT repeat domain-containing protein [Verrucomicrobiaceae bacterium]
MKKTFFTLCVWFLALATASAVFSAPKSFQERLALIKANPNSPFGASSLEALEQQEGRKLTAEERAAFETKDTGAWKTYEDEFLRFEHPDHSLFSVTVLGDQKSNRIQVVGGVASMADNSFERAYHLKVGSLYYGVIFVREADWFDEGICLCGPIAFKKCVQEDGTALEFSLLEGGQVKKVQALGGKHRAILFEWTHSVVPQSAYARLGASLRFKKKSSRTLAEWQALSKEKRGIDGLAAWLERGSTMTEVKALFGEPTRVDGDVLEYVADEWRRDGSGVQTTLRISFKGGVFEQFQEDGQSWKELPPKAGSAAWAESRLDYWQSDKAQEKEKKDVMPGELRAITDIFITNAKTAKGNDWTTWTRIAASVADLDTSEPRLLDPILARYSEPGLIQLYSTQVLEEYEYPQREQMLVMRMKRLLEEPVGEMGELELEFLWENVDHESQVFTDSVKKACSHLSPRIRVVGFDHAHFLKNKEAVNILKNGLDDEEHDVRMAAVDKLDWVVSRDDLEWLKKRLGGESDDQIKQELKAAIDAAEKRKEPYR